MEMNKQRKILVGVLATGLIGLVLDRLVLAPPDEASAELVDMQEIAALEDESDSDSSALPALDIAGSTEAPNEQGESSGVLPTYASLTQRLVDVQATRHATDPSDQKAHDPFTLPGHWLPKSAEEPAPEPAAAVTRGDDVFLGKHRLDGTFRHGEQQRAVVNGLAMSVGDVVAGYRLIRVSSRWVQWEPVDGGRVLTMRASDDLDQAQRDARQAP